MNTEEYEVQHRDGAVWKKWLSLTLEEAKEYVESLRLKHRGEKFRVVNITTGEALGI